MTELFLHVALFALDRRGLAARSESWATHGYPISTDIAAAIMMARTAQLRDSWLISSVAREAKMG